MQHHASFLGPATATTELLSTSEGEESVETSLLLTCDRDALLANQKLPTVVRDWIATQDRWFEIVPPLQEAAKSIWDLRIEFDRVRAPRVLAASDRLEATFFSKFNPYSGAVGYGEFDSDRPRRIQFSIVPVDRYERMRASAQMAVDAVSGGRPKP